MPAGRTVPSPERNGPRRARRGPPPAPALAVALAGALALALIPAAAPAQQADPQAPADLSAEREAAQKRLQEMQQSLESRQEQHQDLTEREKALRDRLEELRRKSIATAAALQSQEEEASALELTLAAIREARFHKLQELERQRAELTRLVNGLTRLSRRPPEAMLFAPGEAYDTWRAAILLGDVGPLINARAAGLRDDLDELAKIEADLHARRMDLNQVVRSMADERARLTSMERELDAARADTRDEAAALSRQVASLTQDAANVRNLLGDLEEAERIARERQFAARAAAQAAQGRPAGVRPAALTPPRLDGLKPGGMAMPVAGRVIGRYQGPIQGSSERRPGLTVSVRDNAQVTAPADARVMFAGPFKGYGRILILAHGENYHTLLAGFGRIDREVGDHVLSGEPVGVMNAGTAGGPRPSLYLELRHEGKPIDPERWIAKANRKASG